MRTPPKVNHHTPGDILYMVEIKWSKIAHIHSWWGQTNGASLSSLYLFEVVHIDVVNHLGHHLGLKLLDANLLADLLQCVLCLEHGPEHVRSERKSIWINHYQSVYNYQLIFRLSRVQNH